MIHLDTSVLIDALTGSRRSAAQLRRWIDQHERILLSTLVADLAAASSIWPSRPVRSRTERCSGLLTGKISGIFPI